MPMYLIVDFVSKGIAECPDTGKGFHRSYILLLWFSMSNRFYFRSILRLAWIECSFVLFYVKFNVQILWNLVLWISITWPCLNMSNGNILWVLVELTTQILTQKFYNFGKRPMFWVKPPKWGSYWLWGLT